MDTESSWQEYFDTLQRTEFGGKFAESVDTIAERIVSSDPESVTETLQRIAKLRLDLHTQHTFTTRVFNNAIEKLARTPTLEAVETALSIFFQTNNGQGINVSYSLKDVAWLTSIIVTNHPEEQWKAILGLAHCDPYCNFSECLISEMVLREPSQATIAAIENYLSHTPKMQKRYYGPLHKLEIEQAIRLHYTLEIDLPDTPPSSQEPITPPKHLLCNDIVKSGFVNSIQKVFDEWPNVSLESRLFRLEPQWQSPYIGPSWLSHMDIEVLEGFPEEEVKLRLTGPEEVYAQLFKAVYYGGCYGKAQYAYEARIKAWAAMFALTDTTWTYWEKGEEAFRKCTWYNVKWQEQSKYIQSFAYLVVHPGGKTAAWLSVSDTD